MSWKINQEAIKDNMSAVFVETLVDMMAKDKRVLALDGDLGDASGFSKIARQMPGRFIEMGIAEANMMGVAAGLSMGGFVPFVHTFAPFASRRCMDQVFLEGAYAGNTVNVYGSDPGFCAATNGGTHTSFEDVALYASIPHSLVFDPADATQLRWLLPELLDRKGVHYIRATRKEMPRLYQEGSSFEVGRGNLLREGCDIVIFSAGILLQEALKASDILKGNGISAAVVDLFTLKPLDRALVLEACDGKKLAVSMENHSPYGGLGSMIAMTLAQKGSACPLLPIAVEEQFGEVGSLDYLRRHFGLNGETAAEKILKQLEQ